MVMILIYRYYSYFIIIVEHASDIHGINGTCNLYIEACESGIHLTLSEAGGLEGTKHRVN